MHFLSHLMMKHFLELQKRYFNIVPFHVCGGEKRGVWWDGTVLLTNLACFSR